MGLKSPPPAAGEPNDALTQDLSGNAKVNNSLPSKADLAKAEKIQVLDENGGKHTFRSLVSGEALGDVTKVLVVFIRHFYCGNCQEYVRTLSTSLPPSSLPANSRIIVIGCGQPELIPQYAKFSESAFPIYADPERKLYNALRMISTLKLGDKQPKYMSQSSVFKLSVRSFWQEITAGRKILSGGSYTQVGGEFLFERTTADEMNVTWCHRMRTTRDHAEASVVRTLLGLSPEPTNGVADALNGSLNGTGDKKRKRFSLPVAGPQSNGTGVRRRLSKRNSINAPTSAEPIAEKRRRSRLSWTGPMTHSTRRNSANMTNEASKPDETAVLEKLKEEGEGNQAEDTTEAAYDKLTKAGGIINGHADTNMQNGTVISA